MGYTGDKKREYQRKWIAQRRATYLSDKACVVCGSTDDLEIDHINPDEKLYQPTALWGMSETNPKRLAELKKCQVLCSTHHKQKTAEDAKARRKHGRTMYGHGCRCETCKEAQRLHNAQRYASQTLK